jgi:hypothetical protein
MIADSAGTPIEPRSVASPNEEGCGRDTAFAGSLVDEIRGLGCRRSDDVSATDPDGSD